VPVPASGSSPPPPASPLVSCYATPISPCAWPRDTGAACAGRRWLMRPSAPRG